MIIILNIFLAMESKQLIDTESSPFKTYGYLAPALITLFVSDDTRLSFCNTRKVDDRAHVPRVNVQFAPRSRTIRIIYCYSFVTFLLELLNANHTEAPSRINATVCYVLSIRIPREHSVRKNYLNFRRDLPVSLLLAIHYLSNGCEKLLDVVPSVNYLCTHLTNALIIEHGIIPTKKVVVIISAWQAFHTR